MKRCPTPIAVLLLSLSPPAPLAHAVPDAGGLPQDLLRLIPSNAAAALVVANIKTCSDEVTMWLDGMERGQLLLGSRPLDHLKSATGLTVGVNDLGGMAVVVTDFTQNQPSVMVLVPVTDAKSFLEGNFTGHEGDRYERTDGDALFARDLQSHVLLTNVESTLRQYQPGGGIGQRVTEILGDRGAAFINAGDAFMLVQKHGIKQLLQRAQQEADRTQTAVPDAAVPAIRLMEQCDGGITVFDFDPLALVLRSFGRSSPSAAGPAEATGDAVDSSALDRLPNKPFYLAAAVRVDALQQKGDLHQWLEKIELTDLPPWLDRVQAAQWAVYQSSAGLAGGLLGDSVFVAQTDQPAELHTVIQEQLPALVKFSGDTQRQVSWQNKNVKDVGDADAYEVSVMKSSSDSAIAQMVERLCFGPQGWRGFVKPTDDSVIVTFSQRPAVLGAAVSAAVDPGKSLESSAVLRTLRQWMPKQRDAEIYIGVGQLSQLFDEVLATFGLKPHQGAEIDVNAPPLGFALDVRRDTIESSLIIPAPIMAAAVDEMMKSIMRPADEHAEPASSDEPSPGGAIDD